MVDSSDPNLPNMPNRAVGDPFERSLRWLQPKVSQDFESTLQNDQQLIATCCEILMLEEMGYLGQVSPEKRSAWAQYIRSCQAAVEGWFFDPATGDRLEGSAGIGSWNQPLQPTYFALHALDALGTQASYPLKFLDKLYNPQAVTAWLEELDWTDTLSSSEQVMLVLASLIYRNEIEKERSAAMSYHQVLDWLRQAQDPKTGLWGMKEGASLPQAVSAGYHFIPFFRYVHRPVMRATRIVDTILQLERSDGSLLDPTLEGFYTGLGAIHFLATFTRQFNYRREEIKRALSQSYWTLRNSQQEDGSFSIPADHRDLPTKQDGYTPLASQLNRNELLANWLSLIAMASSAAAYPEELLLTDTWRFRRWPVFGYLYSPGLSTEREREMLPFWLRTSQYASLLEEQPADEIPLISVIIPCYNLGLYLPEAIASTLVQSFRDFEIVIVDDGSTDDFTQLLLSNLDLPKTRIVHQSNRGLPATRNIGIQQSRGKYICCLDADDMLRPGYFAAAVPILESQPDVGFVTGWFEMFDEQEGIYRYENIALADLLAENQVIEPAVFRREAWEKVGGYCETFSVSGIEDWDLWISIVEAGYRAHVLPEVVYDYRIRSDAMSASMYQPEKWGRLSVELVRRHLDSYSKCIIGVLKKQSARWATLRNWTVEQQRAVAWWERQSGIWQRLTEERDQKIQQQGALMDELMQYSARVQELQDRITELEQSRLDLEEQVLNWHQSVEERAWADQEKGNMLKRIWFWVGKNLGYLHGTQEKGE